jgi:hypothetical protein
MPAPIATSTPAPSDHTSAPTNVEKVHMSEVVNALRRVTPREDHIADETRDPKHCEEGSRSSAVRIGDSCSSGPR